MHICVIGGGLAGTLLTWRLRHAQPSIRVDLAIGRAAADATAASGGGVRAYEREALARQYATESLIELLNSPTLRAWSGYRHIGSTYLRPMWASAEAELDALPDSTQLVDASELRPLGWAGLPLDTVAVLEPDAGHIAPDAFRHVLLDRLAGDARVRIFEAPAQLVPRAGSTPPRCRIGAEIVEYDRVVIAAGAWTPALLARLGVADHDCGAVKAIQYALHPAAGQLPTFFVDEATGLYGRPVNTHTMLLGVPVETYGGPADGGSPAMTLVRRAEALAAERLPQMRLGGPRTVVRSADCYRSPFTFTLRPVAGHSGVLTFTGGSGGSAKSALAASRHAAAHLIADSVTPRPRAAADTPVPSADLPNTLYERVES